MTFAKTFISIKNLKKKNYFSTVPFLTNYEDNVKLEGGKFQPQYHKYFMDFKFTPSALLLYDFVYLIKFSKRIAIYFAVF